MLLAGAMSAPASAAAYDPYTDTNPNTSGCGNGAYTIATRNIGSPQAYFGTMEVRYSPSCQTNWVRANIVGSDSTIRVVKIIKRPSSQPDGQGGWLGYYENFESDFGAGSTFGMQVFAPGSTCIFAGVAVYNSANQLIAYTGSPSAVTEAFC
jgi:hypothetical protein